MAQWTLTAAHYPRPYRSHKGAPPIRSVQCSTCASTATIQVGMIVSENTVVSTGGYRIVRAPSSGGNGGNLLQVGITSLLGIAGETDTSAGTTSGLSNASNRQIPVYLGGETEFLFWTKGAGAIDSSCIGLQKAVIFDSTLQTYFVDSTNSTAALAAVTITDVPDYSLGSTNGPVVVKFLSSNLSAIAHS